MQQPDVHPCCNLRHRCRARSTPLFCSISIPSHDTTTCFPPECAKQVSFPVFRAPPPFQLVPRLFKNMPKQLANYRRLFNAALDPGWCRGSVYDLRLPSFLPATDLLHSQPRVRSVRVVRKRLMIKYSRMCGWGDQPHAQWTPQPLKQTNHTTMGLQNRSWNTKDLIKCSVSRIYVFKCLLHLLAALLHGQVTAGGKLY